ncbi:Cilia- and flagella-associated protein 300 [Clonorchis sinensis]|uniref:Cilia- and flagella-associated protein 300 n=2 Tax=Clonorchis sinensis TaxID=79923 RepID=A0A8T1MIP1_CLOSI|nr:Cilia- and flagella-associated protein 300 [Clonorchis sinensis]
MTRTGCYVGDNAFSFAELTGRTYPSITSKEAIESLMKWSMKGRLHARTFSFDENFKLYDHNTFIGCLLKSPGVVCALKSDGLVVPEYKHLLVEAVPCGSTDMTICSKIKALTARENGMIKKCYDEVIQSVLVSDELRKFFLDEEHHAYSEVSTAQRAEFLFRLLAHVCIGGEVCQSEENIDVYIDFTRKLYRDLLSVQKNPDTKELQIVSLVYKVELEDDTGVVFPSTVRHPNTFFYAIVDPFKRNVILLYHVFGCGEF